MGIEPGATCVVGKRLIHSATESYMLSIVKIDEFECNIDNMNVLSLILVALRPF